MVCAQLLIQVHSIFVSVHRFSYDKWMADLTTVCYLSFTIGVVMTSYSAFYDHVLIKYIAYISFSILYISTIIIIHIWVRYLKSKKLSNRRAEDFICSGYILLMFVLLLISLTNFFVFGSPVYCPATAHVVYAIIICLLLIFGRSNTQLEQVNICGYSYL